VKSLRENRLFHHYESGTPLQYMQPDIIMIIVTNSPTTHIEEELLERYSLGKLGEDECASLEEHLLVCHSCQDRLAETDEFVRTIRAAVPRLAAKPHTSKPEAPLGQEKGMSAGARVRTHDA
jgi:hypothetical protein